MPPLFKNFFCKALLIFLSLHSRVSEATAIIDTTSLSSTDGTTISAITSGNLAGSSAGDFNGDSFEDMIIGMPRVSSSSGLVYVIFGTATGIPANIDLNTLTTAQGIKVSPPGSSAQLGFSVSGIGDINGDSIDDIIIGACGVDKAYVIFGKNSGLSDIDLSLTDISITGQGIVITGPTQLGYQVESAGDFNNDGVNDFMVSSPFAMSNQGAVYVIFGKSSIATSFTLNTFTLPASQGIRILGQTTFQLGYSLSGAGDVNHDGINDIMMGTNVPTGGIVVIVYGTQTPTSITDVNTISSTQGVVITGTSSSLIGAKNSISFAGDLNNDGIDDVALGVSAYNVDVGLTYVIYGKSGGFSANIDLSASFDGFKITGYSNLGGSFGTAITSADLNGDGLSDLVVTASTAAVSPGSVSGRVYVLFGNTNGFSNIDLANVGTAQLPQVLMIDGDTFVSQLGLDISFAKDFNKDGVNDLVILGKDKVYIIYGSGCTSITQCTSSMPPICYASEGCTCSLILSQLFQADQCVVTCSAGYYTATQTCEDCPTYCATCTSSTSCQTCVAGAFTAQNGLCQCLDGYYTAGSTCTPCPATCSKCTSPTDCQVCNEGYTLSGTICESVTQDCNEGYILSGTTCEPVPQILSGAATALDNAQVAISIATLAVTILSFTNPGPITIVSLSEVFLALRLMKIDYPPRLEYIIENAGTQDTIFDQIMAPPDILIDHITDYPLPEKFEEVGFYSSFLVNFWPSLITIIGVVALAIICIFVNSCVTPSRMNPHTKIENIALWLYGKLKQAVKWNLLISTLTGCFGDMGMFTALELKTLQFSSALEWLSFCICLLLNITGIVIQIVSINVIRKLRKAHTQSLQKKDPDIIRNAKKKLEGYEVIFEVFKEDTFLQQSFLLLFNFKIYIFFAVISYFPDYPLVPTLVNSIVGLSVLIYLALVRPHKEKIEFVSLLIAEVLYEMMNICTFLLALDDTYDLNFERTRIIFGDVIIVCNCTFITIVSVSLAIQILKLFKDIYRFIKERLKQRRNTNNTKSFSSIEQASSQLSSIIKSDATYQQQFKNSNLVRLEPNLNPFERRRKKQRIKNSLAILQNLDDSEIIQIQPNTMDHRNKDSPIPKIKGVRVLWKTNNNIQEDRQRRQRNQDLVEGSNSKEKDQTFHRPARLIPAKILRIHGSERSNS